MKKLWDCHFDSSLFSSKDGCKVRQTFSSRLRATATVRLSTMPATTVTIGVLRRTITTRTTRTTSTSILVTVTGTTTIGVTTGSPSALSQHLRSLLILVASFFRAMDRQQLLTDLYRAYKDARKHKRWKDYQLKFEFNLESNLLNLCDELIERSYKPRPSTCFIIHDPKMREVFAADFRDRIIHHLFYNYTHVLFERTFIADSYSCIKGRGTHYGIKRLQHHIRSASDNYRLPCFALQIDIRGYFMSIHRPTLLRLCRKTLEMMRKHPSYVKGLTWEDKIDYEFVDYLLHQIVNINPIDDCIRIGNPDDWNNLPNEKSLFNSRCDCGLPIGNLSSQLFSNVYLNPLDQFIKRDLLCRHYGRYVDDAYIVDTNRLKLKKLIPRISDFLESELGLSLNRDKVKIVNVRYGVQFLGSYIKPYRSYVSTPTLRRMKSKLSKISTSSNECIRASLNSYLGVLSHYSSYFLRKVLFSDLMIGKGSCPINKCFRFDAKFLVAKRKE